ncbi:uncharacterized protein [Primulina eburnea]|uniref:uncharacterized protein n=1 Tax=Primulina eburnea TaxID=1245227 RepID=UPI003C6C173D
MFNLITNCACAKEAWDILQKHCEGSESVRKTRLRMVTSKFESLRMDDKESILEYDGRLRQLSNEAHSLGDPMPNERLVNKVLRSLPERFNVKVCAIEESKDTSKINLDELMSSLRTFEMNLDLQRKDKRKTIALEASTESYDEILLLSKEVEKSDLGEESISLFTKKFGDYLKTMKEKKKSGQKSVLPNITTSAKAQKFTPMKGQFRQKNELQIQSNVRNLDSVQCRECSGYGHYANECANRLRKNKGMTVTLSDEESDDDQGSSESENHTSLSTVIKEKHSMQINPLGVATGVAIPGRNTSSNSVCLNSTTLAETSRSETQEVDDDEVTLESVQTMYEELYEDWIKITKGNAILSKENAELKSQISRLEVILSKKDLELCKVKEELGEATQILAKMNSSSSKLDSFLIIGQNDKAGLGYPNSLFEIGESSNTERKPTVFVKGSVETSNATQTEKGAPSKRQISTKKSKSRKRHFICHYCFRPGHIKPYCFKLRDDYKRWETEQMLPQVLYNTRHNTANKKPTVKRVWVPKAKIQCSVIYTSLKTNIAGICGHVTYGGGAKGRIAGKGTLNVDGLPNLHNVLYVEGLNSNLISISQLCDDGLHVKFDKDNCEVFDNANTRILIGTRSADNCYQLGEYLVCNHSKRGITHEFSAPKTPQQNGIVERKNRTLQEMARVMLSSKNISKRFWAEALNTACHISNRVYLRSGSTMTSYEIIMGKRPNLKYFHVFGCVCYVLNDRDHLAKFDSKSDKCLFVGYSSNSRAYRVYNLRTRTTMESINVVFDDLADLTGKTIEDDIDRLLNESETPPNTDVAPGVVTPETTLALAESNDELGKYTENEDSVTNEEIDIPNKVQKNHPSSQIIGETFGGMQTRRKEKVDYRKMMGLVCMTSVYSQVSHSCFVSLMEPKNINEALKDEFWVDAMHEELEQFVRNYVWDLVPRPDNSKYAKNLVTKFSAENTKHMKTPMGSTEKLSKDDVAAGVDNTQYQADPKVTHLKAVKRILRYIAGTVDLGLWYTKETNTNLVGFSDADWAGNLDDRKSTTGGCFYFGNNLVSWYSRKQNCVSLSTAESEYVAAASCYPQLLWMNQMINDYGFSSDTLIMAGFDRHDIRNEMAASLGEKSPDPTL